MNINRRNEYIAVESDIDAILEESSKHNKLLGKEYVNSMVISYLRDQTVKVEASFNSVKSPFAFIKNRNIYSKIIELNRKNDLLKASRESGNLKYLNNKVSGFNPAILRLGKRSLDAYQTLPVLVDEKNILVIAGAGTGKTSTIIGKIKYLLLEKKMPVENILALTYTKASSEDMVNRIKVETGVDLDVFTFHKLGRSIITKVEKRAPNLCNLSIQEIVETTLKKTLSEDSIYRNALNNYLRYHQYLAKTQFDFTSIKEYEEYKRLHPYVTLKGETVKSGEEVVIANFLFSNGIDYVYEKDYINDTSSEMYKQYQPDFYLPQYEVWIEHFAIDRNNNVPPFFVGSNGRSAKDVYVDGIEWKRKIHKENKTKLVETYSYDVIEGNILMALQERLKEQNVELRKMDPKEIEKELLDNKREMKGFIELFSTIIVLARSKRLSSKEFLDIKMDRVSSLVQWLVYPILEKYESTLLENCEIDYSDMLNRAIDYLNEGKYISPYTQVVVDEFQDMTNLTYRFLIALRKSSDYQLFAVGDDWQSIYRFAGSDIDYITSFEKYFGTTETFKIRKTYRFSSSIAELSGSFIQRNPIQLRKDLICDSQRHTFDVGLISGISDKYNVESITRKLDDVEQGSEVLLIGRFRDDLDGIRRNLDFSCDYNQQQQVIKVVYKNRRDLNIVYRTAHSAKGLESDYVFIINTKEGPYGFPSQIVDNPIINYFLCKKENFAFAEERRLFYVALTRARKKAWLVVNEASKSAFVKELESVYHNRFSEEYFTCPRCGQKLKKKNGIYGPFLGCTDYPVCNYVRNLKGNTYSERF